MNIRFSKRSGFYSQKKVAEQYVEGWWTTRYLKNPPIAGRLVDDTTLVAIVCGHEDAGWTSIPIVAYHHTGVVVKLADPVLGRDTAKPTSQSSRKRSLKAALASKAARRNTNWAPILGFASPPAADQQEQVYVALPESLEALAESGPELIDFHYNPEFDLLDPTSDGSNSSCS